MHPALSKLQTIEQAATKGPWLLDASKPHSVMYSDENFICGLVRNARLEGDAEFIASARKAMPALIAALAEIEQTVKATGMLDRADIKAIYHKHLEPLK